ncbi:MAG: TAXI family TRAP transporter solute-binding subunit [Spirochaetaceae bacterium]|nr:MAG: TAXI family TRAP transporter solute-binding subunit [Spirochaetaceae bacterium]
MVCKCSAGVAGWKTQKKELLVMRIRNLLLVGLLAVVVIAPGFARGETEEAFLGISGGPTGGSFYPVAAGIAKVIEDQVPGVRASAESTGGGVENVSLLAARQTDVGIVTLDALYDAYANRGADHLRILSSGVLYNQLLIVRADSDIRSIADLRGRRVSFGPAGSSGVVMWEAVFTLHGLHEGDYISDYLSYTDAADALRDGLIDALGCTIISAGSPYPVVSELEATTRIRFISPYPDQEVIQRSRQEFPLYVVVTVPRGTFRAITEDMTGVAFTTLTGVRGDLSDDLVYRITKAMIEHREEIASFHPFAAEYVSPENIQLFYEQDLPIPFHPGALQYYREAGIVQ